MTYVRSAPVSVILALCLGSPDVFAAPAVPKDRSEGCEAGREAAARYAAGQYSEAAAMYEQCARASGDAGYWKKAGMARYSARQYAHAIQALGGYPRANAGAGEDGPMVAMLRDAQAQCVQVRFGVIGEAGAPRPERLRLIPRTGEAGRDAIEIPWSPSTVTLDVWLDPGAWQAELTLPDQGRVGPQDVTVAGAGQQVLMRVAAPVREVMPPPLPLPPEQALVALEVSPRAALRRGVTLTWTGPRASQGPLRVQGPRSTYRLTAEAWSLEVAAPRFVTEARALELTGPTSVAVRLKRTREDRARIGLGAAEGAVGLGLLVGGLVLGVRGSKDYRDALGRLDGEDANAALTDALRSIERSSNGAIVGASGLGAGLAAASVAADVNDRLLAAEAGVGGALLIIGLAWLIPAKRRYQQDADKVLAQDEAWTVDREFLNEHRRPELAAATLLGLGTGLVAGAGAALITRAVLRRSARPGATIAPIAAPRAFGLSVQGSF